MRTSTDCTSRADECRRLAKLAAKPEDWQHLLEMAATWDIAGQAATKRQASSNLGASGSYRQQSQLRSALARFGRPKGVGAQ